MKNLSYEKWEQCKNQVQLLGERERAAFLRKVRLQAKELLEKYK